MDRRVIDRQTLAVAAVSGSAAWALGIPPHIAAGIACAVVASGVVTALALRPLEARLSQRPPRMDRALQRLLERFDQASDRVRDLASLGGEQPSVADSVQKTLTAGAQAIGAMLERVTTIGRARGRFDERALTREEAGLVAQLRRTVDQGGRDSVRARLDAVRDQLEAHDHLLVEEQQLRDRITVAVLAAERLTARFAEVTATVRPGKGESTADPLILEEIERFEQATTEPSDEELGLRLEPMADVEEALPAGGQTPRAVLRREGEYWTLAHDGEPFRLRDSKGLRYLHLLLRHPDREFHVLELTRLVEPPPERGRVIRLEAEGLTEYRGDGAEPVLDDTAKASIRTEIARLREEEEEAGAWGDDERAARARAQVQTLTEYLARAISIHGDRHMTSPAERARINVTRTVRSAIERIAEFSRPLGHHLDVSVRTGIFCSYMPGPDGGPDWAL